jgi:streptogramin lyase
MRKVLGAATLAVVLAIGYSTPAGAAVIITEFPIPFSGGAGPITTAAGGIWFAEPNDDAVGRLTPGGHVEIFALPTPYQEPRGITTGPDGAVWFTETGSHNGAMGIGRVTNNGTITEFTSPSFFGPFAITTGPDGNLWFTEYIGRIGRMTPAGSIEILPFATSNSPLSITTGPDGNVWFAEDGIVTGGPGAIGRVTPSGTLTEFVLPTPSGINSGAEDITAGPDGNLWFTWTEWDSTETGPAAANIGRITTSGTITEFPVSASGGWPPLHITAGADGNLWFTQGAADVVASISTTGAIVEYPLPSSGTFVNDIALGQAGRLWFAEPGVNAIGRLRIQP